MKIDRDDEVNKESMHDGNGGAALGTVATARFYKVLAHDLADRIKREEYFARDRGGRLYRYADGVYLDDGEEWVKRACKKVLLFEGLTDQWSSHKVKEVIEFIRVDAPPLLERPSLERLNLANGVLDLATLKLKDHTMAYATAVQLPVRFDSAARCPEWLRFATDWFGESGPAFIAQVAAWLMLPDLSQQKALLILGEGGEGKSRLLTALRAFLGPRNVSAIPLHQLEGDRFKVARLQGKLANFYADLPSARLEGTSIFKSIVAGDAITGEHKFKESFDFEPFARLVFSANAPPRSVDSSPAFFARWIVCRFQRRYRGEAGQLPPQEIDRLLSKPYELSGLLNLALEALPRLRARGFTITAAMQEAHDEFVEATDPFIVWLNANTVDDPEAFTPCGDFIDAYRAYATSHGLAVSVTKHAIGNALKRARPKVRMTQKAINGKMVWSYVGIALHKQGGNSHNSHVFLISNQSREEQKVERNEGKSVSPVSSPMPSPLVAEALKLGGRVVAT